MNLTKKTSEFGVNLSVYSRKNSRINLLICFSDKINVKYLFLSTGHFSTILDLIFRQYIVGLANKMWNVKLDGAHSKYCQCFSTCLKLSYFFDNKMSNTSQRCYQTLCRPRAVLTLSLSTKSIILASLFQSNTSNNGPAS